MADKKEIKASLEVDFTKVEQRLREVDQRQREEDQKAEAIERKTTRLVEKMKEAQASARELESRVSGRIEDMVKDFGKFTVKSILFDTFANYSGINTSDAGPLAGILTAGLVTGATTLNPVYGLLAAMGKSIDFLRDAQRDYQREAEEMRKELDELEEKTRQNIESRRLRAEEDAFQVLRSQEEIKTQVAVESGELYWRTWMMMSGGN